MNLPFSRKQRLLTPSDYSQVFQQSEYRKHSPFFLILAKPNTLGIARLGLAISKKTVNKSVRRNRIKRIIRQSFRLNQQALSGLDIVVVSKKNMAREDSDAEVIKCLNQHWGVLNSRSTKH